MQKFSSRLPERVKKPLRHFRGMVGRVPYAGRGRLCPVCGRWSRRFKPAGIVPRPEARCPRCGALERHRFVWLFFERCTNLFDGRPKQVLHIAPEACFEARLRQRLGEEYLTADLLNPHVMVQMDITDIQYPAGSFDVIYCSHVLEHVPDDQQAIRELCRVLRPGGWAVLMVPITVERTYEDPSITDPAGRLAAFGQENHVRRYGLDFAERLCAAGFKAEVVQVSDLLPPHEARRRGLTRASGPIFYCTKG